jgi:hypothetical protein
MGTLPKEETMMNEEFSPHAIKDNITKIMDCVDGKRSLL